MWMALALLVVSGFVGVGYLAVQPDKSLESISKTELPAGDYHPSPAE